MKCIHYTLYCCAMFLFACKSDVTEEPHVERTPHTMKLSSSCPDYLLQQKENNLNVSIFLDLSDRITRPKTVSRDTEYIVSIANSFITHVKSKKVIMLQDRMQLFFNPEPQSQINTLAENLQIQFDKDTPKRAIDQTVQLYTEEPAQLYALAQEDATHPEDYKGSDIWRFFKDSVRDYAVSDCHRNVLIILTDGYMYYEDTAIKEGHRTSYMTPKYLSGLRFKTSHWLDTYESDGYGFIPAATDLSDLEVLVIGIENLNNENPYSLDILQRYWEDWFAAMGIANYKIQKADLASNVEVVIDHFIQH